MTISPVSAAVAGALISGVAMYAVGPRAERVDAFASQPAYVQTVDGQIIPVTPAARPGYVSTLQPAAVPVAAVAPRAVTPTRTVYRAAAPAQERVVVQRERSGRSWTKTSRWRRRGRDRRRQEGRADWRGARRRRCLDIRGEQALAGRRPVVRLGRGATHPRPSSLYKQPKA